MRTNPPTIRNRTPVKKSFERGTRRFIFRPSIWLGAGLLDELAPPGRLRPDVFLKLFGTLAARGHHAGLRETLLYRRIGHCLHDRSMKLLHDGPRRAGGGQHSLPG